MAGQLGHAGNLMLRWLQLKVSSAGIVMQMVGGTIHFRNYFCVATNSKRAEASFPNQEIRDQSANGHRKHNHHPRHGNLWTISFSQQHDRGHENLQREFSNNKDWIDYCQLQAGLSTINFND
jgi:ABC-type nickel/cobalt efflux system permease component RcnA